MKKKILIAGLVLCTLVAVSASAYVLLSPARTWDSSPNYIVDNQGLSSINDGDGGVSNTVQAVKAWNNAGAGNLVSAQAGSVNGWQLGDGVPMLNFDDPERVCRGSCLAATFTGFYEQRGDGSYRIYDADIVTNTSYAWTSTSENDGCSSEFYIEGVMVHEMGHALGLGHSNVNGSTMYPSVSSCNNGPASLSNDDKAGISALYSGNGGGGGGGSCTLGQKGDSCSSDSECCSGKCKGPNGRQTCS